MRSFQSMRRRFRCIAACCLLTAVDVRAPLADTYVLAIGINEYDHEQQLAGAQRDAVDIAETFRRLGAIVTLLLNREATRARIEAEWHAVLTRTRAGDTVILSYAGHGGQEPDKAPLDEADGLDEAFLLTAFDSDPRRAGFNERIRDDTIHDWLAEAGAKGLKVVLVADACYSGTMTSRQSRQPGSRHLPRPPALWPARNRDARPTEAKSGAAVHGARGDGATACDAALGHAGEPHSARGGDRR